MDKIKEKLKKIPDLPGIYKMIDKSGRIIYIGKSISLKNRVRSYFSGRHKWTKIEKMVSLIDDIEYEVTDTHLEARLKECRLIKDLQPIFNSQFKNHRKYIYLKIEDYNIHNPLSIVNEKEDNCFGPFSSKSIIMELIDSLKNLYPILKEKDRFNFSYKVLPKNMDIEEFNNNKNSLREIFSDIRQVQLFIELLKENMDLAASSYKYEKAKYYRDLINNLKYVKNTMFKDKEIFNKHIVLKIETDYGYKLFYITKGRIINKEKYMELEKIDLENFINVSKKILPLEINDIDEKENMDFSNIMYSEIKLLPKENITHLD